MSNSMRTILIGFIAGAVSVLIFHQFGFWLATELGWARARIYNCLLYTSPSPRD